MEKEQRKKILSCYCREMRSYSGREEKNPVNTVLTSPCGWPIPPCAVAAMYHTAVYTSTDLK